MAVTFIHVFTMILFVSVSSTFGHQQNVIFRSPGLVWLEYSAAEKATRFQYIPINNYTWKSGKTPKPTTVAMTVGETQVYSHVAVDLDNSTFVMVDVTNKRIMALTLTRTDRIFWQVFTGTSRKVNGIAVDWTTDIVYWTDGGYDAIFVASLREPNNNVQVLMESEDITEPYGIVAYPVRRFLFWTEAGRRPRIMQSTLSGRYPRVLVEITNGKPGSLTLDFANERLFWLMQSGDVMSCDIYGRRQQVFMISSGAEYHDLDMYHGQTIVTVVEKEMSRVSIYGPEETKKKRILTMGRPYGLQVIFPGRQQTYANPCSTMMDRCPGLCVGRSECRCPDGSIASRGETLGTYVCKFPKVDGVLIPKSDGIYHLQRNFAEFRSRYSAKPRRIYESLNPITAIASNVHRHNLFFYDSRLKMIKKLDLAENDQSSLLSLAVGDVSGLAVDWISENLYWTDRKYRHIMSSRDEGSFPTVIVMDIKDPTCIALHPKQRMMFWGAYGEGTIERSYMDGTGRIKFDKINRWLRVTGITVDVREDRLYWCEFQESQSAVYTSDLDGTNTKSILVRQSSRFSGIANMNDYLIVSDMDFRSSGIHAFDKYTDTYVGAALNPWYAASLSYGVSFHHFTNQIQANGPCMNTNRNGRCSQLCLPSKSFRTCACSIGYTLNDTRCILETISQPYLVLADQRYQRLFQVHPYSLNYVHIPVQGLRQPFAVTLDSFEKKIYWSDLDTGTISRSLLNGTDQEVLIAELDSYFVALDLDIASRLLFYLHMYKSNLTGSLRVYHLEKRITATIVDGVLFHATGLAINFEHGYAFIAEQGRMPNLSRVNLDGTNLTSVIQGLHVTAVTTQGTDLFLADSKTSKIYRCGLGGENVTALIHLLVDPGDVFPDFLAVDSTYIYWANSSKRCLHKAYKEDGLGMEALGQEQVLLRPAGLSVNTMNAIRDGPIVQKCSQETNTCENICLPVPEGTFCQDNVQARVIQEYGGFCQIPEIVYGYIVNNRPGNIVQGGYSTSVVCNEAHRLLDGIEELYCLEGAWMHIPECVLDYDYCGTPSKGYKLYKESGIFYVHEESTTLHIISIGGGGGGYDVVLDEARAGDGGRSVFGNNVVVAEGGQGGSRYGGGKGGDGHKAGADGELNATCSYGGTAGEAPRGSGSSFTPFCGAGGRSPNCDANDCPHRNRTTGAGAISRGRAKGDLYGGGAGSNGGGTGGGGGYSSISFMANANEVFHVTVGAPGEPSFAEAGQGIVIVSWGYVDAWKVAELQDPFNCSLFN